METRDPQAQARLKQGLVRLVVDGKSFVEGEDFALDRVNNHVHIPRDSELGKAGEIMKLGKPVEYKSRPKKKKRIAQWKKR